MRSAFGLLSLALVASSACGEPLKVYTLSGQHYDEEADCLDADLAIDVIEGEVPPTCEGEGVRCIRSEETGEIYVTSACEVPELYEDLTDATEGPCVLALAAYERGDACPAAQ